MPHNNLLILKAPKALSAKQFLQVVNVISNRLPESLAAGALLP